MRIADIKYNDVVDCDSGICVSVWMQGCDFKCQGCQNPGTWDFNGGHEISYEDLLSKVTTALTANGIKRNLSILGGEPLARQNIYYTTKLITDIRKAYPNIKIYLWTGYDLSKIEKKSASMYPIYDNVDVIIDGPYIEQERDITLHLRGSRNQRILYKGKDF